MLKLLYWWQRLTFRQSADASNLNIDFLAPYTTMFGSRAWGVAKHNSDVDFLVANSDVSTCLSLLDQHNVPYSALKDYYNDVKAIDFIFNGFKYQLCICTEDLPSKIRASQILSTFSDKLLLTDRNFRLDAYERLCWALSYNKPTYPHIPSDIAKHIEFNYPELLI